MNLHDSSNQNHSSALPQGEGPGAYPIPFQANGVVLGSRLDSIPAGLRFWAVSKERATARWYNEMVQANNHFEDWLGTRPAGEYPVPFAKGKRIDEIEDKFRNWGIDPRCASSPWYDYFVRANARYEQFLAKTRGPEKFSLPQGIIRNYEGVHLEDVPQDLVWWALRPSNSHRHWYQQLYNANSCYLDNVYKSRSPGSEPIWFGKRYRGLRLDQVYQRKSFMRWCFDPQRRESGWIYRLKDLVHRLEEWRLAHPRRSSPRQRRKTPDIQNPVGEAIGPWDDASGSAAEDEEYEKDSFVQSDSDELEFDSDEELLDEGVADNDSTRDSDGSTNSSARKMTPSVRHTHKRKRVMISDDEGPEESGVPVGKLGGRYRVPCESSEEET